MKTPPPSTPFRWQQLALALTLASLCLTTLFAILQARPTIADGPFPIVTVILQQGDTPANGGGLTVNQVNSPATNGNGKVGFSGTLENGGNDTEFLWYDSGLTWLSTSLISDVLSLEPIIGISNNGNYVFSPLLENNTDSLWTDDGLLLMEGDPAPGVPGYTVINLSRPTMQSNGKVNWFATIMSGTSQLDVIYHASDVSTPIIAPILQGGDVISGFTIANEGLNNNYFVSDNGNHFITLIQTTEPITQDEYVYVDGVLLLREGDPASASDNWSHFDLFQVNNSGNYVVSGDTDGQAGSDEFIAYNGLIQVREGDTVGGVTLVSSAEVRQLSLNNLGQVAFTWSILGGQEILFFACDPLDMANATAVLRTNDLVDTNGDGSADATITDFNTSSASQSFMLAENGHIYIEVDLDYGNGPLEAIIQYTLPSCTGNTAPIAVNDSYTTTQNMPIIVPAPGVLTNDIPGSSITLTAVLIQTPDHGTVDLSSSGAFTYTPNSSFSGTDTFSYRAFDGLFVSNLATVFITVTGNNGDPGLQVTPLSLESTQPANTVVTQTLHLTNTDSISISYAIGSGPLITYENGPLFNLPNGGLNGANASQLQVLALGMISRGFGNSVNTGNRLADDFVITDADGWSIDTITFYAYQTGSPITSTMTAVNLRIWDGPPNVPTSTILFGDTTTNRMVDTVWSGTYRTADDEDPNDDIRPIMANTVAVNTFLAPGSYWFDWQTDGSLASGPWVAPIVISNVITTGNSLQLTSDGVWVSVTDSGTDTPQGFPFQITGQISDCEQPDWVSVSPDNGALAAGTADHVTITFDSTGLGAGTYSGELCLTSSDSNNDFLRLPITLTSLAPALNLTTTIGTSPSECATNTDLYTTQVITAYYCYTITNNGNITLTQHDLEDSQFGTIFNNFSAILPPGGSFDTVTAGRIYSATIAANTVTTATWVAYNVGPTNIATATDTAAVIFGTPGIVLTPTVGIFNGLCASEKTIHVPIGTTVYYCYTVTNTGEVPLTTHSLTESAYGTIFTTYMQTLAPGESFNTIAVGITNTVQIMTNTVSTAVWTASNGPVINTTGTGTTSVTAFVQHTLYIPLVIRP